VHFSAFAEEHQAWLFDHLRSPIFSTPPRWLWHFEEPHHRSSSGQDIPQCCPGNCEQHLRLIATLENLSPARLKKFRLWLAALEGQDG